MSSFEDIETQNDRRRRERAIESRRHAADDMRRRGLEVVEAPPGALEAFRDGLGRSPRNRHERRAQAARRRKVNQ